MTQPLIVRFTSDWPSPFSPEGERTYGARRREERMIAVTQHQIAAQKAAAREIALSNLAGAQVIASELRQQTSKLTSVVERVGDRLSADLFQAADGIEFAIEQLGGRICASLDEISWQLAQQRQTLDGILKTLLNSRTNEAQQLVRQGLRHSVNDEFEEAEERFLRALDKDSTDYQVLLNLAFIEIHKDEPHNAERYFRKALNLPDDLDRAAKRDALRPLARLHYAARDFGKAFETSKQVLLLEESPTGASLLASGKYAALAGSHDESLERIRVAIRIEPQLFARVVVDPDLASIQTRLLGLLSDLASTAREAATRATQGARATLDAAMRGQHISDYKDLLEKALAEVIQAETKLGPASYADCLELSRSMGMLNEAIVEITRLESLYADLARVQSKMEKEEAQHQEVKRQNGSFAEEKVPRRPGCGTGCGFLIALYTIPGIAGGIALQSAGVPFGCSLGLFWPIGLMEGRFGGVGHSSFATFQAAALNGLLFSGILCGISFFALYGWPKIALARAKQGNALKRQRLGESEKLLQAAIRSFVSVERAIRDQRKQANKKLSQSTSAT